MVRFLVVDDSRLQRVALEALLHAWGHETVTAENGAVGLARVVSERPDAVFVDLEMPVLDGYAFLEGLRDLHQGVPAAVITGEAPESVRERCRELGAVTVLEKPIDEAALRRALEALLSDETED